MLILQHITFESQTKQFSILWNTNGTASVFVKTNTEVYRRLIARLTYPSPALRRLNLGCSFLVCRAFHSSRVISLGSSSLGACISRSYHPSHKSEQTLCSDSICRVKNFNKSLQIIFLFYKPYTLFGTKAALAPGYQYCYQF